MPTQLWSDQVGIADAESGQLENYSYVFTNDRKFDAGLGAYAPHLVGYALRQDGGRVRRQDGSFALRE